MYVMQVILGLMYAWLMYACTPGYTGVNVCLVILGLI